MTRRTIPALQPGELPYEEKLALAIDNYQREKQLNPNASLRKFGRAYGVHWERIRDHVYRGTEIRKQWAEARQ